MKNIKAIYDFKQELVRLLSGKNVMQTRQGGLLPYFWIIYRLKESNLDYLVKPDKTLEYCREEMGRIFGSTKTMILTIQLKKLL